MKKVPNKNASVVHKNETRPDLASYTGFDVDAYLAQIQPDGKVPVDVFWRIIDDMRSIGSVVDTWSCVQMDRYQMHRFCKQPVHDLDGLSARHGRRAA